MPSRIQLSRRKGYRKPDGAIVVARPSKWGNPFKVGERYDRDDERFWVLQSIAPVGSFDGLSSVTPLIPQMVVDAYTVWVFDRPSLFLALPELAGHDLACWCPLDAPCHADELIGLAAAVTSVSPQSGALPRVPPCTVGPDHG